MMKDFWTPLEKIAAGTGIPKDMFISATKECVYCSTKDSFEDGRCTYCGGRK